MPQTEERLLLGYSAAVSQLRLPCVFLDGTYTVSRSHGRWGRAVAEPMAQGNILAFDAA